MEKMNSDRPVVLIGPVSDDPAESVSGVNRAFIHGLGDKYRLIASNANRRHGSTRQSRVNLWNLYYLVKHSAIWLWNLLRHRPAIAHYAISSGWALEKGLVLLWLARLFGARTVGHLHSGGFIDYWNRLSPRRKRFAGRQFAKLDAFVVLSESWKRKVAENLGVSGEKLFVVNNPIDFEFEKEALQMPIDRPRMVILSLGVMGKDKGIFEILSAVEQLHRRIPALLVKLAGPEREPGVLAEVKRQIELRALGTCVELLPSVWGAEKMELFREASLFILPSYYENFPLVILEAAAAGQAIISTPVGATPEFFEEEKSALFVAPGNCEQLAAAVGRLIGVPQDLRRLARGAREAFQSKLSRSQIMESLNFAYRCSLNGCKSNQPNSTDSSQF